MITGLKISNGLGNIAAYTGWANMRELQTIDYYLDDDNVSTSNRNESYTDAFIKHLNAKNWQRAIRYLQKLSKTSLFLPAVARGGFLIKDASKCKRKEIINRVIEQINERNKIAWLKDVSYDGYVNMIANALFTEFRCDSVAAYFIIKNNRIRINRGWVNGWTAQETARQLRR